MAKTRDLEAEKLAVQVRKKRKPPPMWRVYLRHKFLREYSKPLDALRELAKQLPIKELRHARFVSPGGVRFDWKALTVLAIKKGGRL